MAANCARVGAKCEVAEIHVLQKSGMAARRAGNCILMQCEEELWLRIVRVLVQNVRTQRCVLQKSGMAAR